MYRRAALAREAASVCKTAFKRVKISIFFLFTRESHVIQQNPTHVS